MQCTTRPRITELNPHLLCVLCGGYYIDATAITECLHSFCKSCIVHYLKTHKYCPICDVLVHKTKPLQNIRPDKILQSIVYKLIPDLYKKEMCNRRTFYVQVPSHLQPTDTESKGEITESSEYFTANDTINLSLEYVNFLGDQNCFYVASNSKRFFRCQAEVTVKNLQKLIASKYVETTKHEVRFFFNGIQLPEHLTLLDVAYISSWKRTGFIRLLYQVLEIRRTIIKLENKATSVVQTNTLKEDTPSVGVNDSTAVNCKPTTPSSELNANSTEPLTEKNQHKSESNICTDGTESPKIQAPSNPISSNDINSSNTVNTTSINTSSTVSVSCHNGNISDSQVNIPTSENDDPVTVASKENKENDCTSNNVEQEKLDPEKPEKPSEISAEKPNEQMNAVAEKKESQLKLSTEKVLSDNGSKDSVTVSEPNKVISDDCPIPSKIPKIINNLRNMAATNQATEKKMPQLRAITTCSVIPVSSTSTTMTNKPTQPIASYSISTDSKINSVRNSPSSITQRMNLIEHNDTKMHTEHRQAKLPAIIKKPVIKTSKPFSRPWNSAITVTTKQDNVTEVKGSTQKPVKFFKARNTPRFLGNPSSGIRPIFQVSSTDAKTTTMNEDEKKTLKNVPVLKIDPKTLCPITSSSTPVSNVSGEKPFTYPSSASLMSKLYPSNSITYTSPTSTPSYGASIRPITSASVSGKHSVHPFSYDPLMNTINPLLYGIYPSHFPPTDTSVNGPTSLDLMHAMASFHPSLPPPVNSLYTLHHKVAKHEKNSVKVLAKSVSSPSTVHRTTPVNTSTKTSTVEHSTDTMRPTPTITYGISNGLIKNKNKKSSEISSFAINNLIPLDEAKHISHSCSADGVNQICDQVPVNQHDKQSSSSKGKASPKNQELKVTK